MSSQQICTEIQGGCLCGHVRYQVNGAPAYQLICVCEQCQKIGGGFGVGSIIVPKTSLVIEKGSDKLKEFIVEGSEKGVIRKFCTNCGTHVLAGNAAHPVMAVHAGTLDDQSSFKPQVVIWCQSMRGHHRFPEGLPQFPQYPPQS